jgi:hypothetical protein
VTRPTAASVVHSGGDVPLGLHVAAQAAGASNVRLPLSSVEPMYGLDPHVLVGKGNPDRDHGRPVPPHRHRRSIFLLDHISLLVRLSASPSPPFVVVRDRSIGEKRMRQFPSAVPRHGGEVSLPAVVGELLVDVVADGFTLYCCGPQIGAECPGRCL